VKHLANHPLLRSIVLYGGGSVMLAWGAGFSRFVAGFLSGLLCLLAIAVGFVST